MIIKLTYGSFCRTYMTSETTLTNSVDLFQILRIREARPASSERIWKRKKHVLVTIETVLFLAWFNNGPKCQADTIVLIPKNIHEEGEQ